MSGLYAATTAGAIAGGVVAILLVAYKKRKSLAPVITSTASPAAGHYSQAIVHSGQVFVSGLLPITPDGTKLSSASFEEQAAQVLCNLDAILVAAGSGLDRLLTVRVYITDIDNWATFNALYSAKLGAHKPARAVVPVPVLHYNFSLEVEATAAL